jgi:hypothetical protein
MALIEQGSFDAAAPLQCDAMRGHSVNQGAATMGRAGADGAGKALHGNGSRCTTDAVDRPDRPVASWGDGPNTVALGAMSNMIMSPSNAATPVMLIPSWGRCDVG